MNVDKIVSDLKKKYPDQDIIIRKDDTSTEIIVEIEPSRDHPEKSLALAVVGISKLHYHKISTEIYEVLKGKLSLYIDGKKHILKQGEKITITSGQKHFAEGDEVWFLTRSTPGWTMEDHIFFT